MVLRTFLKCGQMETWNGQADFIKVGLQQYTDISVNHDVFCSDTNIDIKIRYCDIMIQ